MFIIVFCLLVTGLFFLLSSFIGLIRFKDFFSQIHAASLTDSVALPLFIMAICLHGEKDFLVTIKLLLIAACILIFSPIATSRLAKAAYKDQDPKKEAEE